MTASYNALKDLKQTLQQIEELEALATRITPSYDPRVGGMPSGNHSRVEEAAVKIADLRDGLNRRIVRYADACKLASSYIDRLDYHGHRNVLRARYERGLSWPQIQEELDYSDLRHVYRARDRALEKIDAMIDAEEH